MSCSTEVVCAGILVADHICDPIERLPREGELIATGGMEMSLGGCAANVAACLKKQGISSKIIGKVGEDLFGNMVLGMLESLKIQTSFISRDQNLATSQTMIVNVKGEDRRFIHCVGANASFQDLDFTWEKVSNCKVLYLGGYLLMNQLTPEHVARVFSQAKAKGIITILDVVTPGPGDYLPSLLPIFPHLDFFLPNDTEAEIISGISTPLEQATFFQSKGVANTLITLGSKGTLLANADGIWQSGVYSLDYKDGSGSGDAFAAGYITGLLGGCSPLECLTMGSALGASVVREIGTTKSAFTSRELQTFVKKNPLPLKKIR